MYTLTAPAHWQQVCMVSDLHLQASEPANVEAFAVLCEQLVQGQQCQALFILGDLFEIWVGDDAPDDAASLTVKASLTLLAQSGIAVYLLHGNRDFLIGKAFCAQACCTLLAEPVLLLMHGQRIALVHGDAQCTADLPYQQFRALVRNPLWQQDFLAKPLAQRMAIARKIRDESESNKQSTGYTDVAPDAVLDLMYACNAPVLIHGHTHEGASHVVRHLAGWPDAQRHVLADWHAPHRGDSLWITPDGIARRSVFAR